MKARTLLLVSLSLFFSKSIVAQDNWEPRTHFTGYINSVAEYSDQKNWKRNMLLGYPSWAFWPATSLLKS